MTPSWKRSNAAPCGVVAACLLLGCGAHPSTATFPTAVELPSAPRRPDGVVVEPTVELPAPAETQSTDEAVVSLRSPSPDRAALRVVAAFLRAAVTENLEALGDLVTPDAAVPNKSSGTQPLVDFWRARMRQLHYQVLAGELLYQEADVELYRYADLEEPLPGRPLRPPGMARADVLLRVPLRVTQSATERLFGSDLVLVLRPMRGRLRIRQAIEDFQLP
jgi:hypothetical protein